jgi:pyroglutamyl-peptidase
LSENPQRYGQVESAGIRGPESGSQSVLASRPDPDSLPPDSSPILVTAFEPFGDSVINASREVACRLATAYPDIETLILPVVRGAAEHTLISRLENGPTPSLILSLGEADPAMVVRLEKVAINWDDYRIPDNAGNQPRDEPIRPDGPAAYFATLPVAALADTLRHNTPIPVTVSLTAGAFLCNHLAYTLLDYLAARPLCPYSFVHIPAWRPAMGDAALQDITRTIRAIVESVVGH